MKNRLNTPTVLKGKRRRSIDLARTLLAAWLLVVLSIFSGATAVALPVYASGSSAQTTTSIYLVCPASVSFASPSSSGSCTAGNFTGTYTGLTVTPMSNFTSEFFLAAATGGVKVTFNLVDVTTGKDLIQEVAYGSIAGGTCANPSVVVPTSFTSYSNPINSGDAVKASVDAIFTGTGTPMFCSGGGRATLVSFVSGIQTGSSPPLLTTLLTAGVASETTLSGFEGVSVSYVNTASTSLSVVVLGVVHGASGVTVAILSTSVTLSTGAQVTAFVPFGNLPSGQYTVVVIALSTTDVPISASSSVGVSV